MVATALISHSPTESSEQRKKRLLITSFRTTAVLPSTGTVYRTPSRGFRRKNQGSFKLSPTCKPPARVDMALMHSLRRSTCWNGSDNQHCNRAHREVARPFDNLHQCRELA